MRQPPTRNANQIGVSVYSHSGEFAPAVVDLRLPGRGIDLVFRRAYRSSLADAIAELGRGWNTNVARRIESVRGGLVYHDGTGSTHRFGRAKSGRFETPPGLYAVLERDKQGLLMRHRHGFVARYDPSDRGGRLRRLEDRNRNAITFTYRRDSITILDTLGRTISVTIGDGLIREVRDHAGRVWTYRYDDEARLVEIVRPSTTGFPDGTSVRNTYDDQHRITSITNPNGQVALINRYDEDGRVIAQEQGDGAFRMTYEAIGRRGTGARRLRTACRLTNGGTVTLEHNDLGNVTVRTHGVRRESFAAEDLAADAGPTVPVVTTTRYNANGEAVEQTRPAGNRVRWAWADKDPDPRSHGNLLRVTEFPASGVAADQASIVTIYDYDPGFQFPTAVTDPRGNVSRHRYDATGNRVATTHPPVTIQPVSAAPPRPAPVTRTVETTFTWNRRGQLLSMTAIDGSVSTYEYYPVVDSHGARGPSTAISDPDADCGYLARIIRGVGQDALRTSYGYDAFGNVASVIDGKGNPSRLVYDALGRVERISGREPAAAMVDYRYDANGNEVEARQSFERNVRDDATGAIATATSTIRELREYDVLDRLVARTIVGDERSITERWGRDAAGRVVRQVQPSGNTTEYAYDERDRLITKTFAAGTKDSFTHRFAWTPNGVVRARTDGNGHTYTNRFDGYHRYLGFTDPLGTTKTQALDAAGNVVRVTIRGATTVETTAVAGLRRARLSAASPASKVPLMEATYHVDEWDRAVRIDRAWHGPDSRPLGSSGWADEPGIVSMVIEYADDGRPGKVWSEAGNVVTVERDALGRPTALGDLTGERWSVARDDNGNPTALDYRRSADAADPEWSLDLAWDELDRLVRRQVGDDAPRRYRHNAIAQVTGHVTRTGLDVRHLHDGLGRRVGHAYSVPGVDGSEAQAIARGFEFDDTFRLAASTDAAGNRTVYRHDALDRQVGVVYADGTAAQVDYDANGNVVRVVDQNGTETVNRYDAANRLVERIHRQADAAEPLVERFSFDPVGRLLTASGPGGTIARTYDSLSRPLTERQGRKTVRFETDAAGNLTTIRYPGGEVVRRRHDVRRRVTGVETKGGEVVGGVRYGPDDAVDELALGGIIRVACAYDSRLRLASIEYRAIADGTLVDGFRYAYDRAGRVAHEIELRDGPASGSRFTFDAANRPVLAQYGVRDVRDPASPFELETRYEHFPEGRWRRRIDRDGRGRVLHDRTGTLDRRNRYRQFGDVSFEHDAAGNVTRKGTDNPGFCLYTYDADNRLVKTECFDKNLNRTRLIEYFYDALGRLVRKVVTDRAGTTTETTYVWAGTVLLEEYENGVLVRTYVYGLATRPARLTVDKGGTRTDYVYVHDGRGQASGLVVGTDPNAFAERYGYEITGASFMKEIDGLPVDFPSRSTARSSFLNAVLSDNGLGGLRDWETGTLAGLGGTHIPQDIAETLNSVSSILGKSRKGLVGVLNDQMTGYLNWLGLGNARTPPGSTGEPAGGGSLEKTVSGATGSGVGTKALGASDISLFGLGAGDTLVSETGFPFRIHGSKSNAPDMPFKPDWTLAGMHDGKLDDDDDPTAAPGGQGTGPSGPESGPDEWAPYPGKSGGRASDAPTNTPLTPKDTGGEGATDTSNVPAPAGPKDPGDNAFNRWVNQLAADNPKTAAGVGLGLQFLFLSTGGVPKGYVDPDQPGSGVIVVRPEQIDMKLNGRKRPVTPNGGIGVDEPLDRSTIPPGASGIDPTQVLTDPDAMTIIPSGDVPLKVAIAPYRWVQGHQPGSGLPVTEGGTGNTHVTNTTGDRPFS
jgi:YD repeat-containing protein